MTVTCVSHDQGGDDGGALVTFAVSGGLAGGGQLISFNTSSHSLWFTNDIHCLVHYEPYGCASSVYSH